jgi:ABC-2 type transport system permease protein
MGPLFHLSLRQLAGRRRLALIVLLAALPAIVAAIVRALADRTPDDFTELFLDGMLVAVVLPIVMMVMATAAFGNEVEDRTLSYLMLKPLSRWRIVAPKYLTVVALTAPLLVAGGVAAALLGFDFDLRIALAVAAALALGTITYAAVFMWAGLISTRALGFGLVYVFVWEGLVSTFLAGIRYLSVRSYTLSVMHGIAGDDLQALNELTIQLPAAIGGAALVTALFLWLTVRRLQRMDTP